MIGAATTTRVELGDGAYMRALIEDDVTAAYVDGLNDPEVHRFLVGPRSRIQTFDTVRDFVRHNREDPAAILFGLFVGDELRGTARLHDMRDGEAFLGLAIFDKRLWGRGWGTRFVRGVTQHARVALGIRKVRAIIEAENVGSQRAFERAGYSHDAASDTVEQGQIKQLWESHTG